MEKGKHSKVWLFGPLAFKIFEEGFRLNAKKEWKYLRKLKKHKFSPKPYFKFGRLICMQRIRGVPIKDLSDTQVKNHAKDFLKVMHQLDLLGIKKEENHRPKKHFFVTKTGVKIIDFERAKEGTGNVTQFLTYLRHYYPRIEKLGKKYKETLNLQPLLKFLS